MILISIFISILIYENIFYEVDYSKSSIDYEYYEKLEPNHKIEQYQEIASENNIIDDIIKIIQVLTPLLIPFITYKLQNKQKSV